MILLDTNIVVWLFQADARLGNKGRTLIEKERSKEGVCFSAITPWEISMLNERGRLALGRDPLEWVEAALSATGVRLTPIDPAIAIDAGRLPGDIHGDPADRIIIATARYLSCPLLTSDRNILAYGEAGHVQTVDARR